MGIVGEWGMGVGRNVVGEIQEGIVGIGERERERTREIVEEERSVGV